MTNKAKFVIIVTVIIIISATIFDVFVVLQQRAEHLHYQRTLFL